MAWAAAIHPSLDMVLNSIIMIVCVSMTEYGAVDRSRHFDRAQQCMVSGIIFCLRCVVLFLFS